MSCYHPNIMTYVPSGLRQDGTFKYNKDGSKVFWKFQGAGFEDYTPDGELCYRSVKDPNTYFIKDDLNDHVSSGEYTYSIMVPCQQCLGCRIDYSKHWADRIVMEQIMSPKNSCWFVTLTYDDEHLVECMTGKAFEWYRDGLPIMLPGASLVKDHVRKFIKDLREYYDYHFHHQGIRYFLSGEYGDLSRRPHFHLCIFNLPITDLEFYANNFRGDVLYNSQILSDIWKRGYVVIGELNWESAAYTARYVVKKFKGKQSEEFYESVGSVSPEFCLSSRRPGLAGSYFDKEVENIYRHDCIQLPSSKDRDGHTTVPRYFDKLLEKYLEAHPESDINLEKIKLERRQAAELNTYNRRILSGLFDKEYFKLKEESFRKSVSILSRKNIDKSLDV